MIEFSEPPICLSLSDYMKLVELWKKAGSCAAFCIRLGHLFFTEGVNKVDNTIIPLLSNIKDSNTLSPRVLPSYSILGLLSRYILYMSMPIILLGSSF